MWPVYGLSQVYSERRVKYMPLFAEGNKKYSHINKFCPRVDAKEKVTGRADYAADLVFPDMLFGGSLHGPYTHAKVKRICVEKALAVPGVRAVLTYKDLNKPFSWGYYTYMTEILRYEGDVVAIVAADTKHALEAGLEAIDVEYEELPAVYTIDEAMADGAPLVHENNEDCAGNIWSHARCKVRKGDVDVAFTDCDVIVEREYETQAVEHLYLEPEAAVAVPEKNGCMTVYACAANPFFGRRWIADSLGIPRSKARLVQTTIGGSFGGKEELMGLTIGRASLLADATGHPVKMVISREESIVCSSKRHPFKFKYKAGVNKDGKLQALQVTLIEDVGAYHMHEFMSFRAVVHAAGAYVIPNVKVDILGVFTNTVTSGAMRGYSSPQIIYAQEQFYEEVAEELGMDFLAFKKSNMLHKGAIHPCGQELNEEVILPEIIENLCAKTDFEGKRKKYANQTGDKRKGIGMSIFHRGCGLGNESIDASAAYICVHDDGSVMVNVGLVENGQGLHTAYSQIVAETLGVPVEKILVNKVDTNTILDSGPTVASRCTVMGAQSVRKAAQELKSYLKETAAMMFHTESPDQVALEDGMFILIGVPDAAIPFHEVCNVHHWTGGQSGVMNWYKPPKLSFSCKTGFGDAFPTYSYSVCVAEVEVDYKTGEITVEKVTSGHDVGTVINPETSKGQIFGGIAMGQGFAMMENLAIKDGKIRNKNLDTFMIASSMDTPEMEAILFECEDKTGTYGAKSLGENATEGVASAIINALHNATGERINKIPINKVKMFELLHK